MSTNALCLTRGFLPILCMLHRSPRISVQDQAAFMHITMEKKFPALQAVNHQLNSHAEGQHCADAPALSGGKIPAALPCSTAC